MQTEATKGAAVGVLSQVRPHSAAGVEHERFLMPDDVVAQIGDQTTSETSIYRALNAGAFPAIRIRSRWIVPSRAVVAMERAAQEFRRVERADWDFGWGEPGDNGTPLFYKLPAAARLLTTSASTLKREIDERRFPAAKLGSRWVVPAAAIDAMERAALEGWTYVNAADSAFAITPGRTPAWAKPVAVTA